MRTFVLLLAGQILSNLGSQLTSFGLNVWIFQETGSAMQFAIGVLASALPRIILAPFAGALIDRWDRRRVMIACDTVLAAKTLAVLLLLASGGLRVWHVYLLDGIGSVFGGFHAIAWSASMTLLVPKGQLARVNGFSQAFGSATGLLAPALAGVLFVLVGMKGIAAIDLASWAFAVVPLLFLPIPNPTGQPSTGETRRLTRDIAEGWRYLRSMTGLFQLLIVYATIGFFGITTEVLLGPYVLSWSGPEQFGLVQSAASLGSLVGGLFLGVVGSPKKAIRLVLGTECVVCLSSILMGALPIGWLVVVFSLTLSLTVSFSDGLIMAVWQRKVRPDFQGRVFALKDTATTALMPVGILGFTPLAEFVMEPRLLEGGAWAGGIGRLIGTGKGRGIGLLFILTGIVDLLVVAIALSSRRLRRADVEIPDHAD